MENITTNSSVSGNPSPSERGGEALEVPKLLADNYENHSNQSKLELKIDYEYTIFQALVNEGKHMKVLNASRPPAAYNEKDLRDAAHAEVVSQHLVGPEKDVASVGGDTGSSTNTNPRKRKSINSDDKAQQSRDRNREHAKNTRLRKKAYVSKLKELVDQMNKQKAMEEEERKALGERIFQTQLLRKNAVGLLLSYRAINLRDRQKWAELLDEKVVFTLPITPYRSFHKGDIKNSSRVIVGIDAIMADAASLALMVENIGHGTSKWKEAIKMGIACKVSYVTAKEDVLAAGDLVMCRYTMIIEGLDRVGGAGDCKQIGMFQSQFDRYNKIVSLEMMFDVMGYMQQIQRASAISPESSIVPNTLDLALQPSKEAQAIVSATSPFKVLHVNENWTASTDISQSEVEGCSLTQILQSYDYQSEVVCRIAGDCAAGRPGSTLFMSKPRANGSSKSNSTAPQLFYIKLCPLTAESDAITHILATIVRIPITSDEVRLFLHSKMALYVSPATVGQPQTQPQAASSSSPSSNAATTTTAAQGVLQPLQQYRQSQQQQQQQQQQQHFRVNAPPTAVGEKAAAEQAPGGSNTHTAFNTNSNTGNSTTHSNASSITSSTTTTTKNTSSNINSNSSNVNTTAFGCTSDANNPFVTKAALPRSQHPHPQSSQPFSTQHMPNPSYLPSQLQYQQFQHNQFPHHNHPAQK